MTETSENVTWLTQEAYDRLKEELDFLTGEGRTEIVKRIEAAREEGDLRENGGYHAAKDEQGKREARIRQLQQLLDSAEVGEAPKAPSGVVAPGTVVTAKVGGETMRFLLGSREVAGDGIEVYSEKSPLGAAINGKHKGEKSTFAAPTATRSTSRSSTPSRSPADRARSAGAPRQRLAALPYCRIDSGMKTTRSSDHPDQRVGDRVLQRPHVRHREQRAGVAELLPGGLGHRGHRVPVGEGLQRLRAVVGRHEGVGDERQREDHDERRVVARPPGSARAGRPGPSPRRWRRRTAGSAGSPATASTNDVWIRQPTISPVSAITARLMTLLTTSLRVRPYSTAERRHRQRPEPVDDALLQVLGQAVAGERGAEDHGLDEDARRSGTPCSPRPGTSIALPNT